MNSKMMILSLSLILSASQVFANREDFGKPSKELNSALAAAATQLGYDLSSSDGRKQFGDYLKSQKDALAATAQADLSTEEGRKKLNDSIKAHVDAIAKAQGFDMTTKEGRDSLEKYLVSTGDLAYLRPEPKDRNQQKGPAKDSTSSTGDTQQTKSDCAAKPPLASQDRPQRPAANSAAPARTDQGRQPALAQQQRQ